MAITMPNPKDVMFGDLATHIEKGTLASGNVVKAGDILAQDGSYKWKAFEDGDVPRGICLADADASTGDVKVIVGFFGEYNKNNCAFGKTDSFSGDAATTTFTLTVKAVEIESVQIGGVDTAYAYDEATNAITFASAPASGTDNVVVVYRAVPTDGIVQALRDKAIYLEEVIDY